MTDIAEEAKEMEPKEEAGKKMTTQAETAPTPLSEEDLENITGGALVAATLGTATANTFA